MTCNECPESKLVLKDGEYAEMVRDPNSETCKDCTKERMREILIKADDKLVGLALQIESMVPEGQDWDPDAYFTPLEHQLHVIAQEFGMDYNTDISDEAYRRRKERKALIEARRKELSE